MLVLAGEIINVQGLAVIHMVAKKELYFLFICTRLHLERTCSTVTEEMLGGIRCLAACQFILD